MAGCGLPEAPARERAAALICHDGRAALQVIGDKPALERAFAGAVAP